MKKHFTFLIMVYCCVAIQAQPRLVRKLRQNHITGAWKDTSDIVFTYNSGGQTLLRTYNGLWVSGTIPGWKDSSVYNTSGQLDTTYVFNWNDSASRFDSLPGGVLAYQYNTSGNLLKIVRYYPTINRTFIDSFVYNSSGWVAEMITIEPDSPWVDYNYKIEYTYNSAGQVLTEIQYYSGPNWIPQNKYESIYISGQLTERQYFRWNNNTTQWDSSQHSSYTYTAGKLTEEIQDRVFGPGTKIKVTYSYNSFGLIEEELYLFYDPPSSSYVNGWKEIYYYASTTGIANVNKT
ncbi:MAG TPA: hypothetical protein VEC12_02460, partial [Bacteroidia bacterium]|nr:hypothetical protein [Bacteroidia bacterium]